MRGVVRPLAIDVLPQPDDTTCGPTCLHGVYRYYGDDLPLTQVIREVEMLEEGGTLAVLLGHHALGRGYQATIYTWNLDVFDLTWFHPGVDLAERLRAQLAVKGGRRVVRASRAYLHFLALGGRIRHAELSGNLLTRYLRRGVPILTGLSATYLYRTPREREENGVTVYDDVRGVAAGHFVVLSGYQPVLRRVHVSDPYAANPVSAARRYDVPLRRLVAAIFLGIMTYDANLLVVEPAA
jgi:hypothetical protein